MKLRIKGNSLRVRLTRSEVSQLAVGGFIESITDFGAQRFRFAVSCGEEEAVLSSACGANGIEVHAARVAVERWAGSEEVGLYAEQATSGGGALSIALEKDFRCLDPRRDEDESDNFDHPLEGQGQHAACAGDSE